MLWFSRMVLSGFVVGAIFSGRAEAHPAHAQPVDYPFVVGFERFYASDDDEAYLAEGGFLLLNELNCVACHAPPEALEETLSGRPGTRLEGVGDRLDSIDLELMVRNPRFIKRGTVMPTFFAGADRDLDQVEALKHFLASLKGRPSDEVEAIAGTGDPEVGQGLYHQLGCVACHAPETGYRPEGFPEGEELELVGLPSAPLNLADRYTREAVVALLLDPVKHRPSGRMPDMKLSAEEAGHLAAYLKSGPKVEMPEELRQAIGEPGEFVLDEALAAKGRDVFIEKNCVACHEGVLGVEVGKEPPVVQAQPLIALKTEPRSGCLAENPPGGHVPWYYLDEVQKKAIGFALERLSQVKMEAPENRIDFTMASLNCYACHDRDGKGGPEEARIPFFGSSEPGAMSLGRWGNLPPPLDHTGWKLTPQWLEKILQGEGGEVRSYVRTRMPRFASQQVKSLMEDFPLADPPDAAIQIDTTGLPRHQRGHFGRDLMGIPPKGLGCVTCHGLKDAKSLGAPVVPLTHTVERLQPAYFKALLMNPQEVQPGTLMPPLFAGRKKADQEVEQLWTYLKELDQRRLPDGLLRTDSFELKPDEEGRPIVFRTFLEGVGTHAIAIGYPGGVNVAFDAEDCRWSLAWEGRFIDAMSTWDDRYCAPAKPLGESVRVLGVSTAGEDEKASGGRVFDGFSLDGGGVPALRYVQGSHVITERLVAAEGGLRREIEVTGGNGICRLPSLSPRGGTLSLELKGGAARAEEIFTWKEQ